MKTYLQSLSDNFTPDNVALIVLGTILYFFLEFKTKSSDQKFSVLIWLQCNWYNVIINLVAIAAYFILVDNVGKWESFAIGLMPNYIVDRLMAMKDKYIPKQP